MALDSLSINVNEEIVATSADNRSKFIDMQSKAIVEIDDALKRYAHVGLSRATFTLHDKQQFVNFDGVVFLSYGSTNQRSNVHERELLIVHQIHVGQTPVAECFSFQIEIHRGEDIIHIEEIHHSILIDDNGLSFFDIENATFDEAIIVFIFVETPK